jgi:glucose-1-phosphate adenylyltransferase
MKNAVAMVLAGGMWSSLGILAERRAKAAIPFGGMYRIIDFVLSNLMNSDIERVGILAQYRPASLIDHVGVGASWDLFGRTRIVKILPPYKGQDDSDWYKGTADAVYQNLNFIRTYDPEYVLVLAGENVYSMDYRDVIRYHREKGADCTLVCNPLPAQHAERFGILSLDSEGKVATYEEKPRMISGDFYSAGIYVFNTEFLVNKLNADAERQDSRHNFADDIIPDMLANHDQFYGYPLDGYWAYCGTVDEYWQANMELINEQPCIDLNAWNIRTNLDDRNVSGHQPPLFLPSSRVQQALVASGCRISGTVERSIVSPGVVIEEGAIIRDSIIFHECTIQKDAVVEQVICDKDVMIGEGARIGIGDPSTPNTQYPDAYHSGITVIGKDVQIGKQVNVGKNCLLYPGSVVQDNEEIQSGGVVQ